MKKQDKEKPPAPPTIQFRVRRAETVVVQPREKPPQSEEEDK